MEIDFKKIFLMLVQSINRIMPKTLKTYFIIILFIITYTCFCTRYMSHWFGCVEGYYDYCRFEGDYYVGYNYDSEGYLIKMPNKYGF